jgi:hypothetical protein
VGGRGGRIVQYCSLECWAEPLRCKKVVLKSLHGPPISKSKDNTYLFEVGIIFLWIFPGDKELLPLQLNIAVREIVQFLDLHSVAR